MIDYMYHPGDRVRVVLISRKVKVIKCCLAKTKANLG